MHKEININGVQSLEMYINSVLKEVKWYRLLNVIYDETTGKLTFGFKSEDNYSPRAFVKVFSKSHKVKRITRTNNKKKVEYIYRGYNSLEEAEILAIDSAQKESLTKLGFEVIAKIELGHCWLVFYAN